ncbi:mucin-2 [Anopheles arabiensis]|uniref:mucin-2 n=1 Tax=Anopheles arabiensis TaxID=7173 RepID=UPI001AADBAC1|nr:mucin-2 [Anopheles arabiensis]XP_040169067.1 mucin-2 [Anopheles arabiensis]XP_040169069.1 mucin-2 [Anopheles arabiensis]XP_040169070.1 mucin-2 [Anopheles arabiensis]XP_040169071.1 mucin-2 [Anopheles arabiensis]
MEPIYGTNKKYLQSIAGSEYYRNPSTLRPMANEYASYQNTLGRRSTLVGPYTHMSKYSYPTDVSLSSHYGYTSWGLWRDSRNLSSSLYAKKQKNIKSFSILLMSAAFIVVLAVLCVAGLAFYFSTFKADLSETILAFDCTFRVARGDIYTTGLRTNSTPVYRQKTAFYEKLIETSLERSGLTVSRTEIMNFGDGPTIALSFRVFLDMRKIKITINNVEEHIRTAFLSEVLNPSSAFKNIRIDPDSIEIKRLLDQEVLKTALLTRHEPAFPTVVKSSPGGTGPPSDQDQRHVTKKTGVIEKTIHKFTPRVTPAPPARAGDASKGGIVEAESDIDMDNLPVIQGSFEITKTDADITQKRTGSSSSSTDPVGRVPVAASTLKPFAVSPAQITIRGSDRTKATEAIKADGESPSTGGYRYGQQAAGGAKPKYETATAKIEKMDKLHAATTKKIKTTSLKPPSSPVGGGGAGRRSTTANVGRSTTTTTTRSPTTTTTTTTTTTMAPTQPVRSRTPTQVGSTTTSRLTTLRYQVLPSQGIGSNEQPSSSSAEDDSSSDEEDELVGEPTDTDSHLPVVVDVIGLPGDTESELKNDTLLETIFQAILNDSIPGELAPERRRIGTVEPDSIPKLDVNLFTSAPVLDKQPWHPINPNQQQQQAKADQRTGLPARKKPSLAEEILYRNRPSDIESVLAYTENPNGQIYYQSYTNPSFGSSTLGIEPLGVADVRPYPLPVDKIHEEVIPDFKYLTPTAVDATEQLLNLTLDDQRFEHLGDGVIAKKPDQSGPPDEPAAPTVTTTTEKVGDSATTLQTPMSGSSGEESQSSDESSTEAYGEASATEGIDPVLSGGLNGTHDEALVDVGMDLESRNSPDDAEQAAITTTPSPAIITTAGGSTEQLEEGTEQPSTTTMPTTTYSSSEEIERDAEDLLITSTTETMPPSSEESSVELTTAIAPASSAPKRPAYVEVETLKYTPSTLPPPTTNTLPELFPITKWEFVNGTRRTTAEKPPTRKVFNETLQALVVVNVQPDGTTALPRQPLTPDLDDLKSNRPNGTTHLQNLSDIFDTLASKLGIQPEVSSKMPPFSSFAKIKNQYRNTANRTASRPTTTRPKRKKNRPTKVPSSTTTTTTEQYPETTTPMSRVIPTVINDEIDDVVPVMLETSSELSAEQAVVGQAEVEVIDPNQYEEMLKSMAVGKHAGTTPYPPSTLVTLLPVKSNSGIRNFRPKTKRPPPPVTHGPPAPPGDKTESRKMDPAQALGLKLMNANKTADGDRRAASGLTEQHPVAVEQQQQQQGGSNKNNTMVETVVRASMRFES